jgi:hypothetical protein
MPLLTFSRVGAGVVATCTAVVLTACGGTAERPSTLPSSAPSASEPAPTRSAASVRLVWPLTGLPAAASARVTAPALSVKIDNAPAARPQSGLDRADLVFECLVEGGLSRFLAVYQSQAADLVGPIRSARPVDGALLRALRGGIFAYSGAARGEIAPAQAYSTAYLLSNDNDPTPFFRLASRRAPQNVYASTNALRAEASRKAGALAAPPALFRYGPVPTGSAPAGGVRVTLGGQSNAAWKWNGSGYLRSEGGVPHLLAGGRQVKATNVVVLRVSVQHSGIIDAAGNEDPFVLAYGRGDAEFLRNGLVEHGSWSRPTVADPFRFLTPGGKPLTLAPGPTWIELVPLSGSAVLLPAGS